MSEKSVPQSKIGFIGAGNMAAALLGGMAQADYPPELLIAYDLDTAKTAELQQKWGLQVAASTEALIAEADIIFLAVKPGIIAKVAAACASAKHKLLVSIAAGVSTEAIEANLGADFQSRGLCVVRAMPNTPALVGAGATAICPGSGVTSEQLNTVEQLLSAGAQVVRVNETQMDAVTGVSGSGPAYIMLIIEAMADGGVKEGLSRDVAMTLAAQTVFGAAKLVLETGKHPGVLKDAVTSPGGTTIAAVAALEKAGLRAAMITAVEAAAQRSRSLG